MSKTGIDFLLALEGIIAARAGSDPESSYTARLLGEGTRRIAQKVGEEGVETALAAVGGDREETLDEAADLLYHLLVLLHDRKLGIEEVTAVLASRHRVDD